MGVDGELITIPFDMYLDLVRDSSDTEVKRERRAGEKNNHCMERKRRRDRAGEGAEKECGDY